MAILECRDLRKAFGDLVAVDGVGFHIAEGETYGLLGPNGAGKTTTISIICGLLESDGGEILIDGVPLTPKSVDVKANIGFVPQDLAIYPDLTATENLRFFARPGSLAQQLRTTVEAAVGQQSIRLRAARFAASHGLAPGDALDRAARAASAVSGVQVRSTRVGETPLGEETGTFDQGASTQLLLFIFLNSLTGAIGLIETRRLGMARRMLSTPTTTRTILVGEALGRWSIALVQGLIIMLGSTLIFGVDWGNPVGAALVLIVFSLVGAGAGMLLGSVLNNDQQAIPVALFLGLGLAALGGSMIPLEIFPDTMKTIAHFTPHAWGNDAFAELVRRNGEVADILPKLAVLAGFAVVLLSMATWRLRQAITA